MTRAQINELKRINELALANGKNELTGLKLNVIYAVTAIAVCGCALTCIAKMAGL